MDECILSYKNTPYAPPGGGGGGAALVFNYTTFNGSTPVSSVTDIGSGITGGVANIAAGGGHHQGGCLWNLAQVDIRAFTTNFTFTLPSYTCALTAGSANITLPANNGLAVNDVIRFGGSLGTVTGLSFLTFQYFITSLSTVGGTTTIQVSTTSGGTAITMGGTGTSNVRLVAICGMTFSIQTSNTTTNQPPPFLGTGFVGDANLDGIGGFATGGGTQYPLGNSVNVVLDMGSNSLNNLTYGPGEGSNSAALLINGGPFNTPSPSFDLNPYGLDLGTGHLMSANITYDGSLLVVVIADTITNAQARFVWPLANLTSIVGGNTAWVGMTCGMIPAALTTIYTWNYSTGYNTRLAAPSVSPVPGTYSSGQSVTLSAAAGATIYYSTNGLPPTTSSTLYTGAISVSATQNIQAIAVQSGFTDSLPSGGIFQIATGAPKVNFPTGFAAAISSGQIILNGFPYLNGSDIQCLQDTAGLFEAGSAWYATPQPISTFTTSFKFTIDSFGNTGNGNAGFTFCLQNYNQSPTTFNTPQDGGWVSGGPSSFYMSTATGSLGYAGVSNAGSLVADQTSGIGASVCLAFDLAVGSFGGVGLYTGGATPTGSSVSLPSTTNIHNGNPYTAAITYNGTTLTLLLTDTVTTNTFSHSWTVDIPTLVGGPNAIAGFTMADGFSWANARLSNWTM